MWLPMLVVVSAVVVSGCLPVDNVPLPTATPTFTPESQPEQDNSGDSNQPEAVPTTGDTAPEATPFDLTQLHATDPSSVNLASGRPTVLEFFAFW
jgi:hypothetical protein